MSYTPGRFVWYEHCSNDIAKARAFYEKLFDWNTELTAMPGSDPYPIIHNGDNGIGGYATTQAGAPSRWLSYLSVSDVDSAYKAALAAGAKSLMAPMDYGSAGRAATIVDPTGGVFSLWRGADGDPAESETTPPGGWIWNELATQDEKTALAFYEKAFGFSHDAMAMPDGTYYILKQGDKGRAGAVPVEGREDADAMDAVRLRRRRRRDQRAGEEPRRDRRDAADGHSRRRPAGAVHRSARRVDRDPEAEPEHGLIGRGARRAAAQARPLPWLRSAHREAA